MEDEKIVDLLWARSEFAIRELSKKYSGYCQKISFNILNSYDDSIECENDAYLALWNAIPPSRPHSLKAFLGKIVRNVSLVKYDYNNAQKRNSTFDAVLCELENFIASSENVEEIYEQGELAREINTFLTGLDKEKRIAFVRRYWYSDSVADISLRLGISESKVKSILFRTRNNLKLHLKKGDVYK